MDLFSFLACHLMSSGQSCQRFNCFVNQKNEEIVVGNSSNNNPMNNSAGHSYKKQRKNFYRFYVSDGSVSGLGPENRPTEDRIKTDRPITNDGYWWVGFRSCTWRPTDPYFKGTETDRRPDKDRPVHHKLELERWLLNTQEHLHNNRSISYSTDIGPTGLLYCPNSTPNKCPYLSIRPFKIISKLPLRYRIFTG